MDDDDLAAGVLKVTCGRRYTDSEVFSKSTALHTFESRKIQVLQAKLSDDPDEVLLAPSDADTLEVI